MSEEAGMGACSVPEHIRAMKPRGTMVKAIGGSCYAYEYRSVTVDGKRKTEMGAASAPSRRASGSRPTAGGPAGAR